MKIIVTENTVCERINFGKKKDDIYLEHKPTGRSWSIEVNGSEIEEVWRGIRGDIRELIQLAKNSLR